METLWIQYMENFYCKNFLKLRNTQIRKVKLELSEQEQKAPASHHRLTGLLYDLLTNVVQRLLNIMVYHHGFDFPPEVHVILLLRITHG